MRFGILASHQYPPEDDLRQRLAELWAQTELAAALGFDSIFAINHFLGNLQTPQTISVVSKLIEHSGPMTVGTSVLILPAFHPVHVAEEFATLDQMSGGRLVLGIGAGYRRNEFAAFGIDKQARFKQMHEAVALIRALWSGEEVTFDGRFYRLEAQRIGVRPFQAGGPPVWVGAGGPLAIKYAARMGDAWILPGNAPSEGWYEKSIALHDQTLAEAGRSRAGRPYPIVCSVHCGAPHEAAREFIRPFVQAEYFKYAEYPQLAFQRDRFDFLWENRFLIGDPDHLAQRLESMAALGIDHVICRFGFFGAPREVVEDSMRLFAAEVMPRLRDPQPAAPAGIAS